MKYIEVKITTTTEASDAVYNMLTDEGAAGVVIEDPNDLKAQNGDETRWDYIEEELIAKLGDDVQVKGYFSELDYDQGILERIKERVSQLDACGLDKGKGIVMASEVDDEDWANAWKQYYKPTKVGEKVVIKPTWEPYTPEAGEVVIELDPGMAFGTGTHETTSMCIRLIEKYLKPGSSVFDVGCGSGILGISAAKLGAGRTVCVDIDTVSCKVSRENTQLNQVDDKIDIRCGNLLDVVSEKADLIVANIIADVIISFTDDVGGFMKEASVFISSGIIKDRRDEVIKKLQETGFGILEVLEQGEWCAVAAGRK